MVKLFSIPGITACLAAGLVASCGNEPKPTASASKPAAKIAHAGHDAQSAVVEDLSTDRAVMAAATMGRGDNALWGYIDKQGQWVIPPRANSVGTWRRNEHGRWEFTRRHAAFTAAASFSDGLAAVRDNENGLIGYIDNRGEWAIDPQLHTRGWRVDFSMGLAPAYDTATEREGFIDKSGAWAIAPQFSGTMGPFAERVAPVYGESEEGVHGCGYISQAGNWFIQPQFADCGSFYEGLAAVKVRRGDYSLWGYINVDNEWVIEPQFEHAERFSDGLARVRLDSDHVAYIDRGGQFIIGPEHQDYCWGSCRFVDGLAAKKDGSRWGYIDKSGAWAIEPQFTWAGAFSEGLAIAIPRGDNRRIGYIDKQGEWAIEAQFTNALPFTRTTP